MARSWDELVRVFWKYVDKKGRTACWEWKASRHWIGHGQFNVFGVSTGSHRVAMMIHLGRKLKKGEFICHKCDNPPCCNPRHLFIGTQRDNMLDMVNKRRGLIGVKNGHSRLTEEQVLWIRKTYFDAQNKKGLKAALAKKFRVTPSNIVAILSRKSWKHI